MFSAATMNERVVEKLTLETKLRRAIDAEEFVLHYQPKVELKTGDIVGLEALIRWRDPAGGLVPPLRFIPLLEETGMILEVGRWALQRAATQYSEWVAAGMSPPQIAVNVSAIQLASPDYVDILNRVLDSSGSEGGGIDLEITESVFVENLADSVEKLQSARKRGLKGGRGRQKRSQLCSQPSSICSARGLRAADTTLLTTMGRASRELGSAGSRINPRTLERRVSRFATS